MYYREMLLVPFEVRIVVLGKRLDALEGRLLVMYITDRYAYETLLQQVRQYVTCNLLKGISKLSDEGKF